MPADLHVVTGAYGYSGRFLARRLLDAGHRVRTLTNSRPSIDPFSGRVDARPLDFANTPALEESLRGAAVLYNTYWVRFNHRNFTHVQAVENTKRLFDAARRAGVQRVIHVSITNPSLDSPFEYFRGKAELEETLSESGLSHAILRPAVLFGERDILINNIAWMLRRFPIFGVFGDGSYGIQPIHVDDLARLAVEQGAARENAILDAVGPERFTYRGLVETIVKILGLNRRIVSIPPSLGLTMGVALGFLLRDVLITREEIYGLMAGLLAVDSAPLGRVKLTEWAGESRETLGRHYASELARREHPASPSMLA